MSEMAFIAKTERDNFSRFGQGIIGTGTTIARDLLSSYISPTDLSTKVRPGHPVWSKLDSHQKHLVSNAYIDGYVKFDLSLTYKVIRNVCSNLRDPTKRDLPAPTKGWGKDPQPCDISTSDDLERLRVLRNNVYGHVSQASLPEPLYQIYWQQLKDVAGRMKKLLGVDYQTELLDLEFYKLSDAQVKDIIREIKAQREVTEEQGEMIQQLMLQHQKMDDTIQAQGENITSLDIEAQRQQSQLNKNVKQIETHGTLIQANQADIVDMKHRIKSESGKHSSFIQTIIHKISKRGGVKKLKEKLLEINDLETRVIPVAPLQHADKLPIELLYASVVIHENFKYTSKRREKSMESKQEKVVTTPEDVFLMNDKLVRCLFLLGDAAHGKTTYCLWLLKQWLDSKQAGVQHNEWHNILKKFDFVFFVPLRRVDPSRASVTDMICMDIIGDAQDLQTTTREVLLAEKYSCLIILDGLDEWKPDEIVWKQIKYQGMPKINDLSNCVFLISMRPWRFDAVAETVRDNDKVMEIKGIDDTGISSVIENVLVHYYNMDPESYGYTNKYDQIVKNLSDKTLASFIQIPLLAVVCVQIWYEGKQTGESLTSFYSEMVDMLIERASIKSETESICRQSVHDNVPEVLSENKNILNCFSILLKLGKFAYDCLMSNEMSLVFNRKSLEDVIGRKEIEFALHVGLLSQQEAPSLTSRNIDVHFFHKSVQEYLAALYVATNQHIHDSFCKQLSDINNIMDLSNIIMFIFGLNPYLSISIARQIELVIESNNDICKYRQSPQGYDRTIQRLYEVQITWYREIKQTQKILGKTFKFGISDVYLNDTSKEHTIQMTTHLLTDPSANVKMLVLEKVSTNASVGIPNETLNKFLVGCVSLVSFHIDGNGTNRSVHKICLPSLKTLHLEEVGISDTGGPLMSNMPMLQNMILYSLNLDNREIGLTSDMVHMKEILLYNVKMTPARWKTFMTSLTDIRHTVEIRLFYTNIDDNAIIMIKELSDFKVRHESKNVVLEFTRIWPLDDDSV